MDFESLNQLRDTLERHPRMHGYYLLNIEPLPLGWRGNEEASLTKAFEALDDQTWKPAELCSNDQLWVDYEVDEASARAHAVEALVGGGAVGHTRETVPESDSSAIWKQFRDLCRVSATRRSTPRHGHVVSRVGKMFDRKRAFPPSPDEAVIA